MIEYDRERHEMLILKWYLDLNSKPLEFANLFAKPLRNLTEILFWSARTVELYFEIDVSGIWIATWFVPDLSGAFWGIWVREDKRQTKAMLAHVNESLELGLAHFPVLMANTKQPRLRSEMERLGWVHQGEVPHLFDGDASSIYWMDRGSRDGRRRRKIKHEQRLDEQPVGRRFGEDWPAAMEDGETRPVSLLGAGDGGPEDGGSEREHPEHKRRRGRKPPKLKPKRDPVARTVGA
jgi:hypothetical protein